MKRSDFALSCAIFCVLLALLLAVDGNRLQLGTDDEGIYLDAAERMLHGQRLYSDFFGYMSPGVFWVQELFFRVFGITMLAGRLPVLIYFAGECALLFWLVARLASRSIAWSALFLFLALQTTELSFLTAQHRWDSGAVALVSMTLAVHGFLSGLRWPWAAAGAFGVLAAVFTPSMLLIPGLTLAWLIAMRGLRPGGLWYSAGAAAAGAAILAVMSGSGILGPLLEQMRWLSQNYSAVNKVPYGAPIGGYRTILAGPLDATLPGRVVGALLLSLPAILPVANLAGWSAALVFRCPAAAQAPRKNAILYLLSCSVALVASTWPRSDQMHLAWVAAVFFVPAAALLSLAPPKQARDAALILGVFGGVLTVGFLARPHGALEIFSPVGTLRVPQDSAEAVRALLEKVKPGDSAFVHPYKPLLYFLTQTKNPTRYSYLAFGMMGNLEEQSVLADLRRSPPRWVMFFRATPQQALRVFPSADPTRLRFNAIENWIQSHYVPVNPAVEVAGYRLLRLNGGAGDP